MEDLRNYFFSLVTVRARIRASIKVIGPQLVAVMAQSLAMLVPGQKPVAAVAGV